jgi:16S rRNA (cytosine967-C5)-methyltransferase
MSNALDLLIADGVAAESHEWLDNCIQLRGVGNIERLDVFKKGYVYIQDVASRLAVLAAGPKPGDYVIDGCAAPGGKSFSAAVAMGNSGRVDAWDVSAGKLSFISEGASRLGIDIIEAFEKDASAVFPASDVRSPDGANSHVELADIVLADVPCSGFGVIRKKPDVRYKTVQDIAGLPDIQRGVIKGLASFVKPGGILLYSTCTIIKSENEDVVEWFLMENKEFCPEGFSLPGVGMAQSGMLTLWPHIHGTDGFFICKLRRFKT